MRLCQNADTAFFMRKGGVSKLAFPLKEGLL